eukprot:TRINITY_DN11614_c0_g1_i1.p1 TRINITY_DN11614_c0_g1~~TRINITY_DN11614_c0_g1_i1.p1  ORF type:complete len:196 (+),score=10.62 TRINITY_DN11614_c0_g1_i1:59-646(+)
MSGPTECTICFEQYHLPKTLVCGHSFCSTCIEPLVADSYISCPLCRYFTPATNVDSLPNNYALQETLSVIGQTSTRKGCNSCLGGIPSRSDGCQDLCDLCFENRFGNIVANLYDVQISTGQAINGVFCKQHNRTFDLNCRDCRSIVYVYNQVFHGQPMMENVVNVQVPEAKKGTSLKNKLLFALFVYMLYVFVTL